MEVGGTDWAADEDDFDWNQDLKFESVAISPQQQQDLDGVIDALESFSQEHLEVLKSMSEALILKKRTVVGQSVDEPKVDGGSTLVETTIKTCKLHAESLVDGFKTRIDVLEKRVSELEESRAATDFAKKLPKPVQAPPKNAHCCPMCPKSFQTVEGLTAHQQMKGHKGERARTAPFLGGKKQSRPLENWRKPSSSVVKSLPSPATQGSQQSLEDTLKLLASTLSAALQAMAGPSSEQKPSSTA